MSSLFYVKSRTKKIELKVNLNDHLCVGKNNEKKSSNISSSIRLKFLSEWSGVCWREREREEKSLTVWMRVCVRIRVRLREWVSVSVYVRVPLQE